MATERTVAWKYMFAHPSANFLWVKSKSWSIPRLQMPSYLVDFGHVYLDTVYHSTILILNYGPIGTSIRLPNASHIKNLEKTGIGTRKPVDDYRS